MDARRALLLLRRWWPLLVAGTLIAATATYAVSKTLPRVYEARVEGSVARGDLERWRRGVALDDGPAKPLAVELGRTGPRESRLRLTFAEGRKHEVKRFCEALGHRVVALRRIAFGPVALGALQPGETRPLTAREVSALRAAVAPAEGPPRT